MKLRSILSAILRGSKGVLFLYTLLTLLLTLPLVTRIATHVPGVPQWAFDESTFLWNIWYLKHSLIDSLSSPLHSELIWYPLGIDLVLYTYNFTHALTALPLALAVNLPFASNIALLLSTILSGFGTYLLVRYLLNCEATSSPSHLVTLSAFTAGLVYAFASNRAIYATLGHYDMVTTQWIPFYALMLLRTLDGSLSPARRRKAALLAGLFFAFTGLAEMISALFLGMFTLIVLVVWVSRSLRSRDGERKSFAITQSPNPFLQTHPYSSKDSLHVSTPTQPSFTRRRHRRGCHRRWLDRLFSEPRHGRGCL